MKTETFEKTWHWTRDELQRGAFCKVIASTINREARYHAMRNGVESEANDIAADIRVEIVRQMEVDTPKGPFALDQPEKTAQLLAESYRIREWARSNARKRARKQSRQAELLENVLPPQVLPKAVEIDLLETARTIGRVIKQTPDFTKGDARIFALEASRHIGIDDLDGGEFLEATRSVEVTPAVMRNHLQHHRDDGLNVNERKAWSRAKAKVRRALRNGRISLLALICFVPMIGGRHSAAVHQQIHQVVDIAAVHQNIHQNVDIATIHQNIHQGVDIVAVHQNIHQNVDIANMGLFKSLSQPLEGHSTATREC